MKRIRKFNNGTFALNLSRFPNHWIPFVSGETLEEALPIAANAAMELENDALEVQLQNPRETLANDVAILCAVSRLRDRRHRENRIQERMELRKFN